LNVKNFGTYQVDLVLEEEFTPLIFHSNIILGNDRTGIIDTKETLVEFMTLENNVT
jgi:hypothetical protein